MKLPVYTRTLVILVGLGTFIGRNADGQQQALFTSAPPPPGPVSTAILTRFDLTTLQPTQIATLNGFAQGLACGPDGKLYIALTGYGSCCAPARQIVRVNLDGTDQTVLLDFATTPALVNSGGPEGPSFGPDGSLYFNTLFSLGYLPATGVWKLPPGSVTPTQVILPFTSLGGSGSATAFLTVSPFAGDLIATDIYDNKVVRVAPPFTSPQTAIDFITAIPEPSGLAVDATGNVYVTVGNNTATNVVNKYGPDGTFIGSLAPLGGNLAKMDFDTAGNLYVGLANTSGPSVMRIAPDGNSTFFGDGVSSPANGVAICPRFPVPPACESGIAPTINALLSHGVITATLTPSHMPCQYVLTIQNTNTFWTNFKITTQGTASVSPLAPPGDVNLYAKYGILPPSGSTSYSLTVSKPGDFVSILADPSVGGGPNAYYANSVQGILNLLALAGVPAIDSTPSLIINNYQSIVEAFAQMPDLQKAFEALFSNPPQLGAFASNLAAGLFSISEVKTFETLIITLEVNVGSQVIQTTLSEILGRPWELLNSYAASFGNIWTALFRYTAGSISITAK